ncbi:hypothetical protein ACXJJ3_20245 [Kribbella sp. WER1]
MTNNVDWPGRGPTWLGVPALVVAVVGGLGFAEISERQDLSRELLSSGNATVARGVQVDVVGTRDPYLENVHVEFVAPGGRPVRAELYSWEDNPQGMPEGSQAPRAGTRYAAPLRIVYRTSDPSVVLANVDTQRWLAQRDRWRTYGAMLVGGVLGVLSAFVLLTIGARRRGLAWWKWYSPGTTNSP